MVVCAADGPSRLWRCVVRYVDQVWTDSSEVLVSVSMSELGTLMQALNVAALAQRAEGFERMAEFLWDLSDRIADVEVAAEADLAS